MRNETAENVCLYGSPMKRIRGLENKASPQSPRPLAGFKKVRRSRLIDGQARKQVKWLQVGDALRPVLGELNANVPELPGQRNDYGPLLPEVTAPEGLGLSSEDPGSRAEAERMMHRLKMVGDWRLISLLGMGGMANVYLAQHRGATERYAAIKLTKDCIIDAEDRERDACYSSTMLEWRTYQLFRTPPSSRPQGVLLTPPPPSGSHRVLFTPPPTSANMRAKKLGSPAAMRAVARPQKVQKVERRAAEGVGALPIAYEYGFVEAPPRQRQHGWLSLQLLGSNLHAVATDKTSPLTWEAFFKMATGMLAAVRELHLRDLVHRDVKPGNFCLGWRNENHLIYLVDFGFAVNMPKKVQISAFGNNEKFCGTPDFASSNALRGGLCGAKDDCESLAYSYLQLWNYGAIPWDVTRMAPRDAMQARAGFFMSSSDSSLGMADMGWTPQRLRRMADDRALIWRVMEENKEIPKFLLSWQLYLSSLSVWELPNYDLLRRLLYNSRLCWSQRGQNSAAGAGDAKDPEISSPSGSMRAPITAGNRLLAPEE